MNKFVIIALISALVSQTSAVTMNGTTCQQSLIMHVLLNNKQPVT